MGRTELEILDDIHKQVCEIYNYLHSERKSLIDYIDNTGCVLELCRNEYLLQQVSDILNDLNIIYDIRECNDEA